MVNINIYKQITEFFVYIIGFAGSGKLSTAVELSNMMKNALIISNNFRNNTKFCSIYNDIFQYNKIAKETQDKIYEITQIMLQTIELYPTCSRNYIFIDELIRNNDHDVRLYHSVVELSRKMNTKILPIVLNCDLPTLQKRIGLQRQRENKNVISKNTIIERLRGKNLFIPPNAVEINNSNMSIKEVAEEIVNQMHRLS
jgi:cytidylate kinase